MTLDDIERGIVLTIDKPYGWTSFQVVNKIKWQIKRELGLKKFKIGHAGTLDPLATGVLLVCVGKATKRIDELQGGRKIYTGTIVLGATTPCFDLERAIDAYYPTAHITESLIKETALRFVGEIEQVPPMFSADKVDGERAYSYARDGEQVEIAPKKVSIDSFEITAIRNLGSDTPVPPLSTLSAPASDTSEKELYRHPQGIVPPMLPQVDFRICCGKGTYIRSIARDFGLALGSGAFLSSLRREQVGIYSLSDSIQVQSGTDVSF